MSAPFDFDPAFLLKENWDNPNDLARELYVNIINSQQFKAAQAKGLEAQRPPEAAATNAERASQSTFPVQRGSTAVTSKQLAIAQAFLKSSVQPPTSTPRLPVANVPARVSSGSQVQPATTKPIAAATEGPNRRLIDRYNISKPGGSDASSSPQARAGDPSRPALPAGAPSATPPPAVQSRSTAVVTGAATPQPPVFPVRAPLKSLASAPVVTRDRVKSTPPSGTPPGFRASPDSKPTPSGTKAADKVPVVQSSIDAHAGAVTNSDLIPIDDSSIRQTKTRDFPLPSFPLVERALLQTDDDGITSYDPSHSAPGTGNAYRMDFDGNALAQLDGSTYDCRNLGNAIPPNTLCYAFKITEEFYWVFPADVGTIYICICPSGVGPGSTTAASRTPDVDILAIDVTDGSYDTVDSSGTIFNPMPSTLTQGRILILISIGMGCYVIIAQACM